MRRGRTPLPLDGLADTTQRHFESWYRGHPETLITLRAAIDRVSPRNKRVAVEQAAFMLLPSEPISPDKAEQLVRALDSKSLADLHMGLIEEVRKVVSEQSARWASFRGGVEERIGLIAELVRMNPDERRRFSAQLAELHIEPNKRLGEVAPAVALLEVEAPSREAFAREVGANVEREDVPRTLAWLGQHTTPARRVDLVRHFATLRGALPQGQPWNQLEAIPWFEAMRDVPADRLDAIREQTLRLLFDERPPLSILQRFMTRASTLEPNALVRVVDDALRLSEGLPPASRLGLALALAEDPPEARTPRMSALAPILEGADSLERRESAYVWLQRAAHAGREAAIRDTLSSLPEIVDPVAWSRVTALDRMRVVDTFCERDSTERQRGLSIATRLLATTWVPPRTLVRDLPRHAFANASFPLFLERVEQAQNRMREPWMLGVIVGDVLTLHGTQADLPRLLELGIEFALAERRNPALRAIGRAAAPRIDRDNVHDAGRISATRRSIIALQGLFPAHDRPDLETALANVSAHVERLRAGLEPGRGLGQVRARALELDNALRTLNAPRRTEDFSDPLVANPRFSVAPGNAMGLGELCAVIWHAIEVYPEHANGGSLESVARDQENMRHSLIWALARSIEDDGHRVCGVGLSQRLVGVLGGYYPAVRIEAPTPAQLLTELAQGFARDQGDQHVTSTVLRRYAHDAREAADDLLGPGGPARAAFSVALRDHMAFDFDWAERNP